MKKKCECNNCKIRADREKDAQDHEFIRMIHKNFNQADINRLRVEAWTHV